MSNHLLKRLFSIFIRLLPVDIFPNVLKSCFFALISKQSQQFFEQFPCVRMHYIIIFVFIVVCQWERVIVGVTIVVFTCGNPVTEHFEYISCRHRHTDKTLSWVYCKIYPVFKMMFVASFVMHPGNGISQYFPFLFIWTSIALVIPCTRQKFCRTILGKVMPQTLPKNTRLPTVPNHQMPMSCNGSKMIPCALHAHTCSTSFSFLLAKACSHHSDHYHYNTEAGEEQVNFCDYLHPLIDKFFQP